MLPFLLGMPIVKMHSLEVSKAKKAILGGALDLHICLKGTAVNSLPPLLECVYVEHTAFDFCFPRKKWI